MISLQTETQDLTAYLTASEIVDFENPAIRKIATELAHSAPSQLEQATRIYEFVRDQVSHSFDIQGKVVTCNASEVLHHREGICFAKSHLLTAMLRCIGIPSGFCYQRLLCEQEQGPEFTLHGLNAIYLEHGNNLQPALGHSWIRVDARGNKPGVQAELCIETEKLAFPTRKELNEAEYTLIYAQPNPKVVAALQQSPTIPALINNLPDEL